MNPPGSRIDWQHELPEHRRWLTTVLRARGVESGAVEEVLQEVEIAAVRAADRLQDPSKLAPWLYRIAVTCALQHRRRMGRQRRLHERYAREQTGRQFAGEPDPLDWLLADEQGRLVREALSRLPPRDREILLLKYTEDWSYRQIAEQLGTSTSAVEARLHRAREKMRQALARLAPEMVSHEVTKNRTQINAD